MHCLHLQLCGGEGRHGHKACLFSQHAGYGWLAREQVTSPPLSKVLQTALPPWEEQQEGTGLSWFSQEAATSEPKMTHM